VTAVLPPLSAIIEDLSSVLSQPYAVGAMCVVAAVLLFLVARVARANTELIKANLRARVLEARSKSVNAAARARKASDAARRKDFVNPLHGPRREQAAPDGGDGNEDGEEDEDADAADAKKTEWRPAPPRGAAELRAAAAAMKLGAPRVPLSRLHALQARSVASGAASGSSRLLQLLAEPPAAGAGAGAAAAAAAAADILAAAALGNGLDGPDGGATRIQQQRGGASSRSVVSGKRGAAGGAGSVAASARSATAWLRPKRATSRSLSEFSPDDGEEGGLDEVDGEEGEEADDDVDDGAPTVTAGSGVAALAALAARRDRGGRPPQHFRMAELVRHTVDSEELINSRLEGMRDDVDESLVREREREQEQEQEQGPPASPGAALPRTKAHRGGLVRQFSVVTWADHGEEGGEAEREEENAGAEGEGPSAGEAAAGGEPEPEPGNDGGETEED